MNSIGIDIGTTTISGVILNEEGDILYRKTIANDSFIETGIDGERIQDVHLIIEKACCLLDECMGQYDDIQSIGLTGQMHGILYLNQEGKAISPLYTWQDNRGQYLLSQMNSFLKQPVASGYGLVTHIACKQQGNVPVEAVSLCTIMDYLGMVLTNRKTPLMHISNGASLGFWNLENNTFDVENLQKWDVSKDFLPELTAEIVALGKYKNVPIYVALGDNQASFLGTVGNQENVCLVNMGTGGQVSMLVDHLVQAKGIETRPLTSQRYLLVGASLCGGRAYAILEKFFRTYVYASTGIEKSQYEVMEKFASMIEETTLEVCTTFDGTRINPLQKGSISQMTEDNFIPEHFIFGTLQGMVRELFEMYQSMGIEASSIMASGNGIRKNKTLQKITQATFQLPLTLGKYEEEAACGAALSYRWAL